MRKKVCVLSVLYTHRKCNNEIGDYMEHYMNRLCRLGIPACSALMIVQDFLKNFGEVGLEQYIEELEHDSYEAWEGVDCVY